MDEELVRRAQRGDREAFAVLATPLANRFIGVARRILRDLDLAQDATQLALIATWQDLPRLQDPARFTVDFDIGALGPNYVGIADWKITCRNTSVYPSSAASDQGTFQIN